MNKNILNTGVQQFIKNNYNTDMMSVLLKKPIFEGISQKELVAQCEAKKKCKDKLPIWFSTAGIYYPNKLHIEQTSSELTAEYKTRLVHGKSLLDVTGGLGVDSLFFSRKIAHIIHCEIDQNLSEIATYNFNILGKKNIQCKAENGLHFLVENDVYFDWIFIDPSRRNNLQKKVFFLGDCLPNVPENLSLLFSKTDRILLKTSPLLDFSIGINELKFVKEIHVVAIENEVKELLWILEKNYEKAIQIKTINFTKSTEETFNFILKDEKGTVPEYDLPQKFLFEPNSAILKSGAFKLVGNHFGLQKLHEHSHLYTSKTIVNFPGRSFRITKTIPYNKKELQKLGISKANVSIRNFPYSVAILRKKHHIKDGGETYLFFTTGMENNLLVLVCEKT